MISTQDLIKTFGDPSKDKKSFTDKHMVMWDIPSDINTKIPPLPNVLYCNKRMVVPLENVFRKLIINNLHTEIKTFDGCFNIRLQRKGNKLSRHSWGIAIDLNAHDNPFVVLEFLPPNKLAEVRKQNITWSEDFLQVWRDNGFICGADWQRRLDGMHFELANL